MNSTVYSEVYITAHSKLFSIVHSIVLGVVYIRLEGDVVPQGTRHDSQ